MHIYTGSSSSLGTARLTTLLTEGGMSSANTLAANLMPSLVKAIVWLLAGLYIAIYMGLPKDMWSTILKTAKLSPARLLASISKLSNINKTV